jgi:repressor LexA
VGSERVKPRWTHLQGQYLAFIHVYTKINGMAPAEADMQRYFQVTPPAVHRMVLKLEERGLLHRTPGKARSIRLLVSPEDVPRLE